MEPSTTPPAEQRSKRTPWGAIIGLVLILAIIVAGAYYSFTKRYHPSHDNSPTTAQQ